MKHKSIPVAFAMIALTISAHCMAQPEPGKLPPPPRPEERARPGLQEVSSFTGHAGEWTNNDDYVIDGFYLQTSQAKYLVKFPPHMGSQFAKVVKAGTSLMVNGVEQTSPEGDKEIRLVSISVNGQTVAETPPAEPGPPVADPQVSGTGKVTALQKTRRGDVNGYVLDNKIILRMPPHVGMQLNSLVSTGATVSYSGMKKSVGNGEVSNGNYSIVHCQTITINGTQYLTR